MLVEYGAGIFLRQALEEQRFRLAPASFYDDASLNAAQRVFVTMGSLTDYCELIEL